MCVLSQVPKASIKCLVVQVSLPATWWMSRCSGSTSGTASVDWTPTATHWNCWTMNGSCHPTMTFSCASSSFTLVSVGLVFFLVYGMELIGHVYHGLLMPLYSIFSVKQVLSHESLSGNVIRTHTCTHIHAYVCAHTHTCMQAYTHIYIHMHICTHMCTHSHIYAYTRACTHTHSDTHTYIHTCTHTQMHTHTHTLHCERNDLIWTVSVPFEGELVLRIEGHLCSPDLYLQPSCPLLLTHGTYSEENAFRVWAKRDFTPLASFSMDDEVPGALLCVSQNTPLLPPPPPSPLSVQSSTCLITWGAGIAQWLECQIHDQITGSSPSKSSRKMFFSGVNFLCWLVLRYLFHPMCYCSST